jgi:hypothetical protein
MRMPAKASSLLFAMLWAALAASGVQAAADLELTTPDGRRVLLKDDRTWRYADEAGPDAKPAADAKPADKKPEGEAVMSLEGKIEGNRICRLQLHLVNKLPYEIRSIVPELSVYRGSGVMYDARFIGFSFIKPGDSQRREARFNGIDCKDISRVLVGGADRCEMGDLDKFSPGRGMCLARIQVVASDVLPFEKQPEAKDAPSAAKDKDTATKDAKADDAPPAEAAKASKPAP